MNAAGTIRPARRPVGWQAPGPRPRAPAERPELWPRAGEDLCHLAGDWRILQLTRGHRWSLDDLATAWFAVGSVPQEPHRLLDLGCGIGAVLMLLAWRFPTARGLGIEAQAVSVALARRSLAWNGADERCTVRLGDLRDPTAVPDGATFDLVTGTPPYLPRGTAVESARAQWTPCHFELRGGVDAYCEAAARLLAPGGTFVACAAARDADRVAAAAAAAGLVVARRCDVVPRATKPPLFAVYAMHRAAGDAPPVVEPPLVVRDAAGRWTADFVAVRSTFGMPS